jgi:hypothetical protein
MKPHNLSVAMARFSESSESKCACDWSSTRKTIARDELEA